MSFVPVPIHNAIWEFVNEYNVRRDTIPTEAAFPERPLPQGEVLRITG